MDAAVAGTLIKMLIDNASKVHEKNGTQMSDKELKELTKKINEIYDKADKDKDGQMSDAEAKAANDKARLDWEIQKEKDRQEAVADLVDKSKKSTGRKVLEQGLYNVGDAGAGVARHFAYPRIRLGEALNAIANLNQNSVNKYGQAYLLASGAKQLSDAEQINNVGSTANQMIHDTLNRVNAERDKELTQEIMLRTGGTPNNGYYQELGRHEQAANMSNKANNGGK